MADHRDQARFPPVWAPLTPRSSDDVSDETLHRILDAAGGLFERFGITRVKVADVAAQAGVSKATIYRYVSSKDSLVELYAVREGRAFIDTILRARWRSDLSADEVADLVADMYIGVKAHPVVAKVLADEPEFFQHEIVASGAGFRANAAAIIDFLAPLLARLGWHDPRLAVDALLRMFVSLILYAPLAGDDHESARRLFRLVLSEAQDSSGRPAGTRTSDIE